MKDKIIETATDKFLNYGFKSITMDDIAAEMGISKKTIYAHFKTKTKLIEAIIADLFEVIYGGICEIRDMKTDPITEIFEIKKFSMMHLKDEKSSPQYQLQKYYPKIFEEIKTKQFELMECCVNENLERGIEMGFYRENLSVSFISRIHFIGAMGIKDPSVFPPEKFGNKELMEHFLEYHLRAISTEKGIKKLKDFIETKNEDH